MENTEQFNEWHDMYDDMDMPTPCQHCNNWFDLNDGAASTKWYPNNTICQKCGDLEEAEVECDEEIEDLKMAIEHAEYTLKESKKRLIELGADPKPLEMWVNDISPDGKIIGRLEMISGRYEPVTP